MFIISRRPLWVAAAVSLLLVPGCNDKKSSPTAPTPPPAACTFSISPTTQSLPAEGGNTTVNVNTQAQCTWTVSSGAGWIVPSTTGGTGNGTVELRADPNTGTVERTGPVQIAGETFQLRQAGRPAPPCGFAVAPSSLSFSPDGGEDRITVSGEPGCPWSARTDVAWLTIVSGDRGEGNGAVVVRAAPHSGTDQREGTVLFGELRVAVRQMGVTPCDVTLPLDTQSFDATGGNGQFDVAAPQNCRWTARSDAAWIRISMPHGGQGTGSARVEYVVEATTQTVDRTAPILVGSRQFLVRQAGRTACDVTLAFNSQSFDVAGGRGQVDVNAQPGCSWTARSHVAWIHITAPPGGQGSGSGRVDYGVDANGGENDRNGSITIGGRPFSVRQLGAGRCEFQVSPTGFTLHWHETAGTVSVATQTGCPWTIAKDAPWMTVSGPASRQGPSTFTFSTSIFTDETTRTAPIMVRWPTPTAGQNVSVNQEGCRYGMMQSLDVAAAGGPAQVMVYQQPVSPTCSLPCPWTAVSRVPWIQITSGSPNAGDNPVHFNVSPNPGPSARSGTIVIMNKTVTVTQVQP